MAQEQSNLLVPFQYFTGLEIYFNVQTKFWEIFLVIALIDLNMLWPTSKTIWVLKMFQILEKSWEGVFDQRVYSVYHVSISGNSASKISKQYLTKLATNVFRTIAYTLSPKRVLMIYSSCNRHKTYISAPSVLTSLGVIPSNQEKSK